MVKYNAGIFTTVCLLLHVASTAPVQGLFSMEPCKASFTFISVLHVAVLAKQICQLLLYCLVPQTSGADGEQGGRRKSRFFCGGGEGEGRGIRGTQGTDTP